jgi:hypothetical protein
LCKISLKWGRLWQFFILLLLLSRLALLFFSYGNNVANIPLVW